MSPRLWRARHVTVNWRAKACLAGLALMGALVAPVAGSASASIPSAGVVGASVSLDPNGEIGNEQTVTVSWSGLKPTAPDTKSFSLQYRDLVGVYECLANPPGAIYYYTEDCYTQTPPNDAQKPSDGNLVDPMLDQTGLYGVTGVDGQGQIGFQVQEGTLHTNQLYGDPPFNIQCDQTNKCVIKVVDFGKYFDKNGNVPNLPGNPLTKGDWSEMVDAAPSVPIVFAPTPNCPPPAVSTPQLHVEGAGSSSYALESWDAQLCKGSSPLAVDYTTTGEVVARGDFQSGMTDVALAALPPTSGPNGGSYAAAPLDVSGAAIAFRISDQVTGTIVTTVRLTPRLVAMLVTDSATFGNNTYPDSAQVYPLTQDPEFQALNPGVNFPGGGPGTFGVIEPLLEGSGSDDTQIITQWIADDADARAFLAGDDPCGAQLNPNWAGVHYPTPIFKDLEQSTTFPAWSGYYNPLTNLQQEVTDLFYGKPAGFNPVDNSGGATAMPPVVDTQDAMFAELDYTSTTRAAEPSSSLSAASPTSTIGQYVTEPSPGHCAPKPLTSFPDFTTPSPQSLTLALGQMKRNPDGTLQPPVTTRVEGAYPLTKVDYAFLPTSNLTEAQAAALAQFARYVGGPGQSPSILPYGYSPLPSSLTTQDNSAAVAALNGIATAGQSLSITPGGTSLGLTSTAGTSVPTSTLNPATGTATQPGPQSLPRSPGTAEVVKQLEGPVSIAALVRTAWWLLPLIGALALALGLAGAVLGWEYPIPRRKKEPS